MTNNLDIKNREGNLLIESMVAISVVLVGFLGVLGLLSRSLGINRDVSQKFIATYLAAEGSEVVKSLIDKDFVDGRAFNETVSEGSHEVSYDSAGLTTLSSNTGVRSEDFLLLNPDNGVYGYVAGNQTVFKRTIFVEEIDYHDPPNGTDELKINSIVEWSSRGESREINLEDHFFNWRL
jgi:hypothetical protein